MGQPAALEVEVIDPLGRRLSAGLEASQRLELVQAVPTSSGSVFLHYRVLRDRP